MRLRDARATDVTTLLLMMEEFNALEGIASSRAPMQAALEKLLADERLGRLVLAEEDDAVVGYAVVTWGYDLEFGGIDSFLTEFFLVAEARGRGLGKRVLAAVEELAHSCGARALHLGVRPDNTHALSLYRGAGYQPWTRLMFTKLLGK